MNDNSLLREIEDDIQRQRLDALWKRYGAYIIGGAVAIVLITAAVSMWRSHIVTVNQEATAQLVMLSRNNAELAQASAKKTIMPATAEEAAKQVADLEAFATANHGSKHAGLALMRAAGVATSVGDNAKAIQLYDAVAGDTALGEDFQQLAVLLAVQLQAEKGDAAQLRKRLDPLMQDGKAWRFSAMETAAHLALKMGDRDEAKRLFTELSQLVPVNNGNGDEQGIPSAMVSRSADMLRWMERE